MPFSKLVGRHASHGVESLNRTRHSLDKLVASVGSCRARAVPYRRDMEVEASQAALCNGLSSDRYSD
ncbi:hypothetical protein RRG08_035730 [Elysia crispata]|uniref:Uncharacterized protein n=1 Tax=Elysia crispata TaxID=231223 RepID=A0AAE0YIV0_9GAST|nr:hypothetical protein RRG08_035730 [Elysia crispata]